MRAQSCICMTHGAYSESNIPAIIQHAEQAGRHNAIRPRSKGAREDRRERERERMREREGEKEQEREREGERESQNTRVAPVN